MKRILFVLPSLAAGGAERVMSFIAQNLDDTKYDVTIIVIGFEKDSVYSTGKIRTIYLNHSRLLKSMLTLIRQINQLKPQIVVSTLSHVNIFMGFISPFFKSISFVGREASVVTVINSFTKTKSTTYLWLIKHFYRNLTIIICQSEDMLNDFSQNFGLERNKLTVINNPITLDYRLENIKNKNDKMQFVTVGRLSAEKGYDRILRGLAKIKSYDFCYTIIGNGDLKEELFALADFLNLKSKINHIPYTKNVLTELALKDVFLQGSYVEGFPNAALESCLVSTPVIAFNAPGGTNEVIKDGINGFIVDNEDEFAAILNDKVKLNSLNAVSIREYVTDKFNAKKIIKKYDDLFSSM